MVPSISNVTKFLVSLVVTAMVCSLVWDELVNGRLYDCPHGGSLDCWFVGQWVHHPITVDHVVEGRSMSEPDTIKAGWSITGLWLLWFSFVASSLVASLTFASVRWGPSRRDLAM